jgi:hypothetical protein
MYSSNEPTVYATQTPNRSLLATKPSLNRARGDCGVDIVETGPSENEQSLFRYFERRNVLMKLSVPIRWQILLVVVALGITGLWSVYVSSFSETARKQEPNYCAMTYMWPNYLEIKLGNNSRLSQRFQLFLYKHALQVPPTEQARTIVTAIKFSENFSCTIITCERRFHNVLPMEIFSCFLGNVEIAIFLFLHFLKFVISESH